VSTNANDGSDSRSHENILSARRTRRQRRTPRLAVGRLLHLLGLLALSVGCWHGEFGHFKGEVKTQWLPDGRTMRLLADFAYIDPDNLEWDANTGSQIDGASIPQIFWSLIGGPFEGQYRNASIVHDVACQQKNRDWHAVHTMFYNACRCGGVNELEAKILFSAVYHFGPRWGADQEPDTAMSSEDDLERLQLMIATDPGIATKEIEKQTPRMLMQRVPHLPPRRPAESVALPRLQATVDPGRRADVRVSPDARRIEFLATDQADASRATPQIGQARAKAASQVDAERRELQTRIAAEKDPVQRGTLARQLLALNRERAAISKVEVQVQPRP